MQTKKPIKAQRIRIILVAHKVRSNFTQEIARATQYRESRHHALWHGYRPHFCSEIYKDGKEVAASYKLGGESIK